MTQTKKKKSVAKSTINHKVKVTQMFMLDNARYHFDRVWLVKQFDIAFLPHGDMYIDIEPYIVPQKIYKVVWDTKENEFEVWMETRSYGSKLKRKDKLDIKLQEPTNAQKQRDADIEKWKACGWVEEVRQLKKDKVVN
jgi:hypothetical protein